MTGLKPIIAKFAVFAAVSLLLLWVLVNTMLHGVDGDTHDYKANFSDVNGLRVGDDVKIAGVRVGRVKAIDVHEPDEKSADVTLQVEANQKILTNSTAKMLYQNLVGQRYISIVSPLDANGNVVTSGPGVTAIGAAQKWTIANTNSGFDLTELLNGFKPLFNVLQPKDINTLAETIVQVLQGEGPTVDSLLKQTAQLTQYIASRDKVIGSVLTNLTPVLNDFAAHGQDLHTTVVNLKDLMTGLANDRQQIGNAISGVSSLVGTTQGLLDQVRTPLMGTVSELRQAAEMLAASRSNLVSAINGFNTGIAGLGRATSYENALNIYICTLGVSLLNLPTVHTGLSHGSAVCQ